MNLALTHSQFSSDRIFFMDSKPNSLIDGLFTKINYCDEQLTMNGIFIISQYEIGTNINQKSKMESSQYRSLSEIENDILRAYCKTPKTLSNKLSEALNSKYDIVGTKTVGKIDNIIIKISGIWENKTGQIGLSYRII
jgi:hypothetical protein